MFDLVDRPDFVHAAVDRMVAAWNTELDQFISQNLLSPDGNNTRIGSGGYGYTKSLPNPAVFAYDDWHPGQARKELRELLERGRGCHVELIMKDISTVRYDPKRLWEWSDIAMETAHEFAS